MSVGGGDGEPADQVGAGVVLGPLTLAGRLIQSGRVTGRRLPRLRSGVKRERAGLVAG